MHSFKTLALLKALKTEDIRASFHSNKNIHINIKWQFKQKSRLRPCAWRNQIVLSFLLWALILLICLHLANLFCIVNFFFISFHHLIFIFEQRYKKSFTWTKKMAASCEIEKWKVESENWVLIKEKNVKKKM